MSTSARRILIIGDAIVDSYLDASAIGISDEAPVMVLEWKAMLRCLGGVLNVASSIAALGAAVETIALIGEDETGTYVRQECESLGIQATFFTDGRPTIEKTRVESDGAMIARLDAEDVQPIDVVLTNRILDHVRSRADQVDAIVVSDYAKGLVTPELARALVKIAQANECSLLVDAKPALTPAFTGADLIKPNESEARAVAAAMQLAAANSDVESLGAELARSLKSHVLITQSADGMDLFSPEAEHLAHVPSTADPGASNVSGAGDIILAALAALCPSLDRKPLLAALAHADRLVANAMKRTGTCRILPEDRALLDR